MISDSSPLPAVYLSFFAAILTGSTAGAITLDQFDGEQAIVANQSGASSFSAASTLGAIGGARKMKLTWLSGADAQSLSSNATVVQQGAEGTFVYSQDATVVAQCLVSWDGTLGSSASSQMFGAGLDLTQDGGNAFTFEILSNDLRAQLEVALTDATDPSKVSKGTLEVEAGGARTVTLPFSSFSGNANIKTTGSISLLINKAAVQALDLSLGYFGTNGQCRLVPNSNGRVIDECGICGGDNKSCADCAGTPNGTALTDQCGVCGGNGTSCLDCNGVLNGTAQLDRCNICNGDGTSCLECSDKDITLLLSTMDASAKSQEALLKNIYRQIDKSTNRKTIRQNTAALRKQAHALQIRNWTLSWTIPRIATSCQNKTFCFSVSNEAFVEEYRRNSNSLRQMTVDGLKLWQKLNRSARKHVPSYLRSATRTHKQNEELLTQVPLTQSVCT